MVGSELFTYININAPNKTIMKSIESIPLDEVTIVSARVIDVLGALLDSELHWSNHILKSKLKHSMVSNS
jgi:hypothetical protein